MLIGDEFEIFNEVKSFPFDSPLKNYENNREKLKNLKRGDLIFRLQNSVPYNIFTKKFQCSHEEILLVHPLFTPKSIYIIFTLEYNQIYAYSCKVAK